MSAGKHHIIFRKWGVNLTFSVEDDFHNFLAWAFPHVALARRMTIENALISLFWEEAEFTRKALK